MYRVLIVDDEYWVGKWLHDVLQKSPFPLEMIGICQDGEEALETLRKKSVDILITDINMPVVTGLELISETRNRGRDIPKTIVISGYDEFEYARQAIELEVLAYLLKPLEREVVFEAIQKAIALLDKEQKQAQETLAGHHAAIENLLAQIFYQEGEILEQQLYQGLKEQHLEQAGYMTGMLQNLNMESSVLTREFLQEKLEHAFRNCHVFLFRKEVHTWYFLVVGIQKQNGYVVERAGMRKLLKDHCLGVSQVHMTLSELKESVREAKQDILSQMQRNEEKHLTLEKEIVSKFAAAVRVCDKEKIKAYSYEMEAYFGKMNQEINDCLNFYFVLTGEVLKILSETFERTKETKLLELINEGYEFCVQIRGFYNPAPISRKFLEYSLRVVDSLGNSEVTSVSSMVEKAQRIIREKYAEDLSLGAIADEFGINPSYFSKKFKDETGENFVDYLSEIRIEQAKALLRNSSLSITQICERVGYRNSNYFSRVFVSMVGERPSDYRARYKGEGAL